jgi:hypothetical protein
VLLLDAIRNILPVQLSSFGEAAVRAYAALPMVGDWTPGKDFQPIDAQMIVAQGWPLAILGENASLSHILKRAESGKLDATDWSVIHAGALLTKLGARAEFLKEELASRTADIRAWWGGTPVDAEVRTAMVKDRQIELQRIMNTLREAIGTRSTPGHPLIHLGRVPVVDVQSQILDAVIELEPGKRRGEPDVWEVLAVRLDEEKALVDPGRLEQLRPAWWKDDSPSVFTTEVSIVPGSDDRRRIRVEAKLEFLSYLNQICAKADRPQGNPNNPYLVVVDQGSGAAMPMRHQTIHDGLQPWLSLWPHVSGILCFDQRPFVFDKFCWKLSFHPNPHATLPLPAELLKLAPHDAEICERPFA